MSDFNETELQEALREPSHFLLPCCRRIRSPPTKIRLHHRCEANVGMSYLVKFDNLIPFEMDLNEGADEKRIRVFTVFYHFGAKLYDCLHMIALELENKSEAPLIHAILQTLNFEHFLTPDCRFPSVCNLFDIIETRQLDECQMLFRIADLLEEHKEEKPEEFGPYDPTNPKLVPLDCAVDAITSVATMCYCFLATTFTEDLMKAARPEVFAYGDEDDDEGEGGVEIITVVNGTTTTTTRTTTKENDGDSTSTTVTKTTGKKDKPRVRNFRKLPPVEPLVLQQNAMLLLATRLGIEQFLILSKEIGKLQFQGTKLSRFTPLMEAAASSEDLIVNRLLAMGADPNAQSVPNCNTAIIYAAAIDSQDVVRELLCHEGPIRADIYLINNFYHDAMMEAAIMNSTVVMTDFLELGNKPRFIDPENRVRNESALTLAAFKGNIRIVTSILNYHEEYPPQSDQDISELCLERYTALMEAAMEGHIDVCKLMISRGTPPELVDQSMDSQSPLMLACNGGYPEIVEVLLAAGAKIDELNSSENTPLMEACIGDQGDQIGVVRLLLSKHAEVNVMNPSGDTPLSYAARMGYVGIMQLLVDKGGNLTAGSCPPIVEAAMEGRIEPVQFTLAHCMNIPQEQLSRALISAAEGGHLQIVEELVRAGADLNFEQDERTAMMRAARNDHFEVVQFLVNKGASINFKSSKNDATALSLACSEGNMNIAQFLIRNGGDPMLKMDDGVNCFMEVARHGNYDLMSMLVEFTKGNMDLDKSPPKLGIHRCKNNKNKKRKCGMSSLESDVLMMLNGGGFSQCPKRKGSKNPAMNDLPYSTNEIDMLTHMLKLQQQMVAYEVHKCTDLDAADVKKAFAGLEVAYGYTPEGKINFPPPPNRCDMDKLYNGELVPNIKAWAEQVAHGWIEMERKVGKSIDLISFAMRSEGQSTNAAAAVSAVAAAATGMDSQAYLASVFTKMNNGEEMPRVPATVGSLNAASAAMTGISFHSDDAMRIFGGATFASKLISDNKKACHHSQFATIHHIQEIPFRAALLKMSTAYKERKGAAICVRDMESNFPIETQETRLTTRPVPNHPKTLSLTVPSNSTHAVAEFEISQEQKDALDAKKVYPGILQLAHDMDKAYRANPTDATRDIAVTTAYIASTLPDHICAEMNLETGDRLLKKLLSGMSEKQKIATMTRMKHAINTEASSDLLRRSVDTLSDKGLKDKYLKLFRQTADNAFYDKCVRNQRAKAVEQKKRTAAANVGGQQSSTAPKTQMVKQPATAAASTAVASASTTTTAPTTAAQAVQQQQGQLRRTHSEGDGAERAKNRSNAIDKATETTLETPLTIACANGHRDIVELLLKEGANIEHRDKKGFSPLIIASTAGHAPVVDLLLKNHAAIEAQSDRTKDTALSLACSGGRKEVVELLLAHNANKEHRNVSDYTPLALASSGGYLEIVNMLVAAGAEINSRLGSKLGISPLMLAAMNGHRDATRVLLEKGSDINAQIETNRNTALTLASFQGRSDVVKLLLDNNANVEHRAKTGLTPLMECASGGYVDVGMLLIHGGADSNASPVQSTKDTALTIAAEKGHDKFVTMLLEHDAAIDTRNKKGCTALWLACNAGHLSTAKALIDKGADPDTFDNRKMSPMMAAFRKGHVEMVKYMVDHAKQFPNEQDLARAQQTAESEEIKKKCTECIKVIRDAKRAQAASADESAKKLLESIELEKKQDEEKKQKLKEKKKAKKEEKKKKLEPEPEPEQEPEPVVEPEPMPEPEPEPEPESEPEPAPEPDPIVEEPPKEPPKPRRNRRRTNPDGIPKGPKVPPAPKPPIPEEEPSEMPYRPIVVTIPPPAQIHAPLMSPGSHSETEEWCKAGKKEKVKPPKKEEKAPKTSPPGYAREKSAASSSASDRNQSWEVDTKNKKVHMMTIPGKACSRVIGKSGSNINAVRAHTTAVIEIDKKIGSVEEDRHIVVRGPPDVVKKACNIIQLCVEDTSLMIDEAIRLVDNHSVVSSASSDGTSKSIAESNQSSIPQSMSSASIAPRHSSSPVPSSSKKGHHHHHQNSKDQDGGNVWQQRMAARQEREPTPELPKNAVSSSPSPGPTPPPPHQPPHQPLRHHSVTERPAPTEPVRLAKPIQVPAPVSVPTPTQPPVSAFRPATAMPPPIQQPQQPRPQPVQQHVQQPRLPEPIGQRYQEPISRPQPVVQQIQKIPQQPPPQPQPTFSKAPGTRPNVEFSRAPGPPPSSQSSSIASNRNELFDERLAFGQYKPSAPAPPTLAPLPTVAPSTSSFNTTTDEANTAKIEDFDISKYSMFDNDKLGSIWGGGKDDDAWGGLFSGILSGTASSLNSNTAASTSTSKAPGPPAPPKTTSENDWATSDFMTQLLSNSTMPTLTSTSQAPSTPSTSQVTAGLSALELKGWVPSPYSAAPNPSQNRSQPPLFARSQSTIPSSSSTLQQQQQLHQLQQQQQQQEQQRQMQQQQQQQQQQQRQMQQQFQQQFQQQSSQNSNDVMGSKYSMMQNQQLYNQLQSMNPSMSSENVYSQLAHQLMAHNAETAGGSGPGPSSSNQMPNSYYPSPSYTDNSVLGQLNMSTLTSRGIKQFDGFNNEQSGSDPLLQALLLDQQQQKKNQPTMGSSGGFMQPPPFTASTSNPTQSRMTSSLGMMQSRQQPPPFVTQPPQAPPGFPNLGGGGAQQNPGQPQRLYQAYGQQAAQQQQAYNQMAQMDWNRLAQQQQPGSQQNPQQQQQPQNQQPGPSSNKWTHNW